MAGGGLMGPGPVDDVSQCSWMWHLDTWVSAGLGSAVGTVGLDDLEGFFQP